MVAVTTVMHKGLMAVSVAAFARTARAFAPITGLRVSTTNGMTPKLQPSRCRTTTNKAPSMSATAHMDSGKQIRQPAKRISDEFEKALNDHAKVEFGASMTYLAMAHWFESINLEGFADFYHKQALEEREHANKFWKHILKRGGEPIVPALPQPKSGFKTVGDAVFFQLENERIVSKSIHNLLKMAHQNSDFASIGFLQAFADYQVEEEDEAEKMYMKSAEYGKAEGRVYDLDAIAGEEAKAED